MRSIDKSIKQSKARYASRNSNGGKQWQKSKTQSAKAAGVDRIGKERKGKEKKQSCNIVRQLGSVRRRSASPGCLPAPPSPDNSGAG